jgi:hypothetical protein
MADRILYDSAMRLFGDLVTPGALAAAAQGVWPAELWRAVEEAGYLDVLAEGASGMVEAATILRAAGHHAAPIPLAETMLARWLCTACGLAAPTGALTIGPVEAEDRLEIADGAVSGHAGYIPWGRAAAAVVLIAGNTLLLVERAAATFASGTNLAGEPRDHLDAVEPFGRSTALPSAIDGRLLLRFGALFRAAQMAGAMEAALGIVDPLCQRPHPVRPADRQVPGYPATIGIARRAGSRGVGCGRERGHCSGRSSPLGLARHCRGQDPRRRGRRRSGGDRASGAWRDRLYPRAQPALPDPAAVVVARRVRY